MAENKEKTEGLNNEFVKKVEQTNFSDVKNSEKPQMNILEEEILSENTIINKKVVSSIMKAEYKKKKEQKRKQQQLKKEREKRKKHKIKELIKNKKLEEKKEKKEQEEALKEFEKRGKISSWFRLDNAASIYPSAISRGWNFVYRLSVVTKEKVNAVELQKALDDILPRFPTFNVKLKHGFFWNYFEPNFAKLKVLKEADFPCLPFDLSDGESHLLRVLYSDHKIILEVFHSISDGRGSLVFFNSLLARYIERLGENISDYVGCCNYLDVPCDEEMEDSFFTKATKEKLKRPKEKPAYKIKGEDMPAGVVNSVIGEMSVEKLKSIAKSYDASISVFLSALVAYVIYIKTKNGKKPVRISVPVDLRKRFNSKTLRNFSSYLNIGVEEEGLTFEDVIRIFKNNLENVDNKIFQGNINANVNAQKNFFVKIMPLFIKNIALKTSFNYMGENCLTLALSNLGKVSAPKEFDNHFESYAFNLGRSLYNAKSIGVISFNNTLTMCISSKIYETETERDVFRFLVKLGVPVKVYSNRRDLYGTR